MRMHRQLSLIFPICGLVLRLYAAALPCYSHASVLRLVHGVLVSNQHGSGHLVKAGVPFNFAVHTCMCMHRFCLHLNHEVSLIYVGYVQLDAQAMFQLAPEAMIYLVLCFWCVLAVLVVRLASPVLDFLLHCLTFILWHMLILAYVFTWFLCCLWPCSQSALRHLDLTTVQGA